LAIFEYKEEDPPTMVEGNADISHLEGEHIHHELTFVVPDLSHHTAPATLGLPARDEQ
jgi:hypothetical protein